MIFVDSQELGEEAKLLPSYCGDCQSLMISEEDVSAFGLGAYVRRGQQWRLPLGHAGQDCE
jgi:hypothetical protein